jgi:hypothetical protein
MANNNTKARLKQLKRGQTGEFTIPMKISGNHGGEYSTRTLTITKKHQTRLPHSGHGKVAGRP